MKPGQIVAAVLFTSVLSVVPRVGDANANPLSEHRRHTSDLTAALVTLSDRYAQAHGAEKQRAHDDLLDVAEERKDLVLSLIDEDPAAAVELRVPRSIRSALPADVASLVERDEKIDGELEVRYEDYGDGRSRLRHALAASGRRVTLHFGSHVPDVLEGTPVRANGVVLDDSMAVASGDGDLELLARPNGGGPGGSGSGSTGGGAALPNAIGEQKTLVLLVNFQDASLTPYTVATAQSIFFGTTNDYFKESSGQKTWLSGDVFGWFTIAASSSVCDTATIAAQAKAAASSAGISVDSYAHLVFAFPQISCGWWGLSSVAGSPSQTWITGDLKLGVTAHELGHALGLFHSHSSDCGATTLGASCTSYDYGDTMDMMGASSFAHFNPFQKERLGWLNAGTAPPITNVTADGTYVIDAYESAGSGPKALKIQKSFDASTGKRTWYYVHARQPIGFDAPLAQNANVTSGVLVSYGTESNGNSTYLVDMTPASGGSIATDWSDPALTTGRSFEDPAAGVTITVGWVSATQAAVAVHFGAASVPQSIVTAWTDSASYAPGQTVAITAEVTSGSAPVVGRTVDFKIVRANGSTAIGSATTGSDGTAMFFFRLRKQDPIGTYQSTASADGAAATTTFNVQ